METDLDRDTEQWRRKYYDSLKELESRERQWGDLETLLRRSMSRLTLLGDGADPQLDRLLERLRNSVREERDHGRIRGMVDEITRRAEQIEAKAKVADASSGEDVLQVLDQLSDELPFPQDLRRKVKGFRRSLERHPQGESADSLVAGLIGLLAEAMERETGDSPPKAKSGGMLGRLFASSEDSRPDPAAEAGPATSATPDQDSMAVAAAVLLHLISRLELPADRERDVDRLREKIAAARRQAELEKLAEGLAGWLDGASPPATEGEPSAPPDSSRPGSETTSSLLRLLESLELTEDLNEQAAGIKAELARARDDAGISHAIAAVADLVSALRASAERERREIEEFLARLTERLRELDTGLDEAGRSRAESFAGTLDLHNSVGSQVRDIEQGVREAVDLESLKQSVQTRLDAILDHMTRHREAEQARQRQAEDQIKALKSHTRELEQESESLREAVHETRELALRDALTGLYNRRAYEERLDQEFARWRRHGSPFSVVVWDLDHFKRINDQFGHQAGDKVLRVLGRILRDGLRASDFSARYGGEEFVSLLPETGAEAALTLADTIRETVRGSDFQGGGGHVSVGLSAGIAQASEGDSPEALIERADQALYRAKQEGRNRCRIAAVE